MTTLALALAIGNPTVFTDPGHVISNCYAHYYYAGNISGTIVTTIKDRGKVATITTRLQISSPDRFFFEQYSSVNPKLKVRAISDGKRYAYPAPRPTDPNMDSTTYLVEPVLQNNGFLMDYKGMYGIISETVVDRSVPLEIAIGRDRDLQTITSLLSKLRDGGTTEYKGETVNIVLGQFKPYPSAPKTVDCAFFINSAGDLRFFKVQGTLPDANNKPIAIETEWDVSLKVNDQSAIDKTLYSTEFVDKR